MKIVRTIVWVLLLVALLIFSVFNWNPVEVKIWEGLVLETKIPALVVVAFLLGLVPMWLLHRASRWANERRIASLENAARSAAMAPAAPSAHPPHATAHAPLPEEPRSDLSPDETKPTP
jgi:putative membrane protein